MDQREEAEARRPGKSNTAFRTISEVAGELDVPAHVLRFWEGKFNQIRPMKRGGGRRYYRPEDMSLLRRIRDLLYKEGYTIKGVQKLLRDGRAVAPRETVEAKPPVALPPLPTPPAVTESPRVPPMQTSLFGFDPKARRELESLHEELGRLKALLADALAKK